MNRLKFRNILRHYSEPSLRKTQLEENCSSHFTFKKMKMKYQASFLVILISTLFLSVTKGFIPKQPVPGRGYAVVRGERWGDFESKDLSVNNGKEILGISGSSGEINVLPSMGDNELNNMPALDEEDIEARNSYNLNKGKAMEVLGRQLPLVFFASNLDFSIFAQQIVINDGKNRMAMPFNVYTTVVKSLKLASTFSTMYPSMNVRKIEYLEDCSTIQCLVDVVLPDSIRIDGASSWEGMFYFGLDSKGLISSHTFDKKISNKHSGKALNTKSFPWIQSQPQWSPELLAGAALVKSVEDLQDEQ